jgi:multicomponent Na+:H+ antiporter subunit E
VIRILILLAALTATWLVWSGLYKPLLLGLGIVSVALTLWLVVRMKLHHQAVFALDLAPRLLGFWAYLLVEVVKSNFAVARIILSPRMPIAPSLVKLEPHLEGQVGRATLANCITLTPSTVTLDAHRGVFIVHCLTEESAEATRQGEFGRRLERALGTR